MKAGIHRTWLMKAQAALAVLLLAASACGGGATAPAETSPATSAAPAAAEAPVAPAAEASPAEEPVEAPAEESSMEGGPMEEEEPIEEDAPAAPAAQGAAALPPDDFTRPQVLEDVPFVFSSIVQTASLDPAVAWSSEGMLFVRSAYDTLLEYPPGAAPAAARPALAEDWTMSDDGLTYTFTLREDVVFHDGNEFDSTDVVRSLERIRAVGRGPAAPLANIESFSADGPYRVSIRLSQPDVFFTGLLPKAPIVSAEAVEANSTPDDPWAEAWFAENEAGSGPYTLDSLAPGMITLDAFPDYWREFEPGTPTRVTLRTDPDAAAAVQLICQGEVDAIGGLATAPRRTDQAAACSGVKGLVQQRFGVGTVMFNTESDGPVADVRVRRAIAAAVDYRAWLDYLNGRAEPAAGPLPSNAEVGEAPPAITRDLEGARALMAEAGYPGGGPDNILLTITYAGLHFLDYQAFFGALLTESLEDIGIGVDVNLVGWPELVEMTKSPDTAADMTYLVLNMTSTDPSTVLKSAYISSARADEGGYNWAYYSNPLVDELTAGVSGIADPEERGRVFRRIQDQIISDQAAVWLPQPAVYQPVLEKWDLEFEPLDFVYQTRFFHARNTEIAG